MKSANKPRETTLQFDMSVVNNHAHMAALFHAARLIDARVDGYVGSDESNGDHHFQIRGVPIHIVVKAK